MNGRLKLPDKPGLRCRAEPRHRTPPTLHPLTSTRGDPLMKLLRYGPMGREEARHCSTPRARSGTCRPLLQTSGPAELRPAGLKARPLSTPTHCRWSGSPRARRCRSPAPASSSRSVSTTPTTPRNRTCRFRTEPVVFTKAVSCLQGPNDPVMIPKDSNKTDWEVELGVVIGTDRRYVEESDGARSCRRLCRRQRCLRARIPDRARWHMGQGQGLRHLRADRPVARHA